MNPELKNIYAAHLAARQISFDAYAAYWSQSDRDYLTAQVHKEFAVLAAALGYRIDEVAKMEARAA